MHANGESPNFLLLFTLESDSQVYTEVRKRNRIKRRKKSENKKKIEKKEKNRKIRKKKRIIRKRNHKCLKRIKKKNNIYLCIFSHRWFAIRRWSSRMVAKEPFPSTGAEYIYVCINRHINCIRTIHSILASMFQTTTHTASGPCKTAIDNDKIKPKTHTHTHFKEQSIEFILIFILNVSTNKCNNNSSNSDQM